MAYREDTNYRRTARRIATRERVPVDLFLALIGRESGWDPGIRSPAGAIGLAQLMPGTARGLGVDPSDPEQNLTGGARYLRQQLKSFGSPELALAAYNAGPGAVQKYGGIPPYKETQAYVRNVLGDAGNIGGAATRTPGSSARAPSSAPPSTSSRVPFRESVPGRISSALLQDEQPDLLQILRAAGQREQSAGAQRGSQGLTGGRVAGIGGEEGVGSRGGIRDGIRGGLAEAFYDPIGQFDNGRFSAQGIGGHGDHVHLSITDPRSMLAAIGRAQKLGLSARENPYVDPVDPVHVKGSYHYRDFPGKYEGRSLGQGLDVSGDPAKMAAFFRWAVSNLGGGANVRA